MDAIERRIAEQIIEKAADIAKKVKQGNDVEIRKKPDGIKILVVNRKNMH